MDCFNAQESVGVTMSIRWILFFFFIVYQVYKNHKHELSDLIQHDKADKQQKCLQNILDHQSDGVIILAKPEKTKKSLEPILSKAKPTQKSKAKLDLQNLPGQPMNIMNISNDSSVSEWIEQKNSKGELDPSFISFVNTTENNDSMQQASEVVFHNQALFKIIGEKALKELQDFISAPVFSHKETRISLMAVTQNRQSDYFLSQAFVLDTSKKRPGSKKSRAKQSLEKAKIITFQRIEIFYNERKCIMLNLRDISD